MRLKLAKFKKELIARMLHMVPVFLLTFFVSCINPINIDIDTDLGILIVEGAITTQPGPHKIRLSRSARYGNNVLEGSIRPISKAIVVIRDSDGNNFVLTEEIFSFFDPPSNRILSFNTGVYTTTDDFSAVVNKSYTLSITTANGTEYSSLPERLIPATELSGLSAEFTNVPLLNDEFVTGFNIFATFQDAAEEQNFYMWQNGGTYKITTFPSLFLIFPSFPPAPAIPAPKDCCDQCWVTENRAGESLRILGDANFNGSLVTDQAAFIEDDGLRFSDKYLVRIEQHTLTREAFQFFSLLNGQLSINGDIFDPPPATLRGNIINLTNPDENVIGYFRTSDVSVDSMFITHEMLLEPSPLNEVNDDCREYRGGTIVEPSYW